MGIKPCILLTGVTGYVGSRLKRNLESLQFPLRCLVRSNVGISEQSPSTTEYIFGDASERKVLMRALEGVDIAYYLIHSLGVTKDFSQLDRLLAAQFAQMASKAKVKKIIYLGGLGANYDDHLSQHLKSRHEVGNVLRANTTNVQVIEMRASAIIGSGSLSFEMIKHLVDCLPIIPTPKWMHTKLQPIAIEDVLNYLIRAIDLQIEGDSILEIGGKERVSYAELMSLYGKIKNYRRYKIGLPFQASQISSLCIGLLTPLYVRVSTKLIESAQSANLVHDPLATHLFQFNTLSIEEAMKRALVNENDAYPYSRWNDAVSSAISPKDWSSIHFGGRLEDCRQKIVAATPENAFAPLLSLGEKGYPFCNFLFWLRGFIDLLLGGVGMRRGRKGGSHLMVGDVVDFWRVQAYQPNHYLKLIAEIKLPGKAWLEFQIDPHAKGVRFTQRALFSPAGIPGVLYWYILYPFHRFIFWGLFRGIIKKMKTK